VNRFPSMPALDPTEAKQLVKWQEPVAAKAVVVAVAGQAAE
jgi:hypothetical protein